MTDRAADNGVNDTTTNHQQKAAAAALAATTTAAAMTEARATVAAKAVRTSFVQPSPRLAAKTMTMAARAGPRASPLR